MPITALHVTAASRLHFGLLSIGTEGTRHFGGVGVMVAPPQIRLRIEIADQFSAEGPEAPRVVESVGRWQRFYGHPQPPRCRVVVESLPQLHCGLGVGTQLGLSVAKGLQVYSHQAEPTPQELAQSVGRGLRSAVGTYGFMYGGLVYEPGKAGEVLAPLGGRVAMPPDWRFVLIRLRGSQGLCGELEQNAFADLPPVPPSVVEMLSMEVTQIMLPAAKAGDFRAFSESVYRYGHQAGMSFASVQGGAYHGPLLTAMVERLRGWGIRGVGQSSWGPTLFALCADSDHASLLLSRLATDPLAGTADVRIACPWNQGAIVQIPPAAPPT